MILLATANAGKCRELGRLLGTHVDPIGGYVAPAETGGSYRENAWLKIEAARSVAPPGATLVADDSGLEVTALCGAPGLGSARFGGPDLDDAGRVALLLERLDGAADRSARFVCVLVALRPDGEPIEVEGVVQGIIVAEPRGSGGFGYDPVFLPRGETRTTAELSFEAKAAISHRGRAARELRVLLDL